MNFKYLLAFSLSLLFIVNLSSQTYYNQDRYSTNHFDGWTSCTPTNNPNLVRGVSHWIMYDLGEDYILGTSHIWNINDPENLNNGIHNMAIDYSDDGIIWKEVGVYTMPQSDGSLFYQGVVGPNFNNESYRYILMTAIDNYGGSCFGFSELKINVADQNLPLTLVDFSIHCNSSKNINVKWTTEDEIGIEEYEIQGSDNFKDWQTIKIIKSDEDHEKTKNYESGLIKNEQSYYRLKMIHFDGTHLLSDIESPNCDSEDNYFSVLPNPSYGITQITFISRNGGYSFSLYNIQGKLIHNEEMVSQKEEITIDYNTSKLTPGTYYVNINTKDKILVKKLIVL